MREADLSRSGHSKTRLSDMLLTRLQSPTSDGDSSYTHKNTNTDETNAKDRSGSTSEQVEETGEMMDNRHESAAEDAETREQT